MRQRKIWAAGLLAALVTGGLGAQNPIVQTCYTTDPAPMVHDGTLYVYTGHDEDGADFFWMQEWRIYSTQDMVNWTDHGSPLAIESFEWADDRAWASQCIERNGKFYWYVPLHSKLTNGIAVGVAVGDSPTGPFKDALGKPLFDNGSWDNIDPTVFIDDDGRAYLYWGNPNVYCVELNDDMISFKGEVKKLEQTVESFGAPGPEKRVKGKKYRDTYTEGPWLSKHGDKYHLLYAAGGVPEHIAYSTSDSPMGPWKYSGTIMPLQDTGSFTNHCGVIDFKGHSYFFYHTGKLPGGGGFSRSVAVEEFKYNADGSFPTINATQEGVKPIATFNPYRRVEAETIAFSEGLGTRSNAATGVYVSEVHDGDYIKVREVDFGQEAPTGFRASVASALRGGTLEVDAGGEVDLLAAIEGFVPEDLAWGVIYEENWAHRLVDVLQQLDEADARQYAMQLGQVTLSDEGRQMFQELADGWCAGLTTDEEKTRQIFTMMQRNLVQAGGGDQSPEQVWADGGGICQGWADLLKVFLHSQGIPCFGANGYVNPTEDYYDGLAHAWTFAFIDGEWYLADAMWGTFRPCSEVDAWGADRKDAQTGNIYQPQFINVVMAEDGNFRYNFDRGVNIYGILPGSGSEVTVPDVCEELGGLEVTSFNLMEMVPDEVQAIRLGTNISYLGEEETNLDNGCPNLRNYAQHVTRFEVPAANRTYWSDDEGNIYLGGREAPLHWPGRGNSE